MAGGTDNAERTSNVRVKMFPYKNVIKFCVQFKCAECYSIACYVLSYWHRFFSFLRKRDFLRELNIIMNSCCIWGCLIHKNKYLDIHKSFYYFSFISFDWIMDFVQSVEAGYGPGVRTTHTDQSHSRWEHGGAPDWWKKTAKGLIHPLVPSYKRYCIKQLIHLEDFILNEQKENMLEVITVKWLGLSVTSSGRVTSHKMAE